MVGDAMDMGDDDMDDDTAADELIDNIAGDKMKGGHKIQQEEATNDFGADLDDLKNL